MKIVDRKSFLALPIGTVFQEYEPCIMTGLYIKAESWDNDYLQIALDAPFPIEGDCILDIEKDGPCELCCIRDGLYKEDQLYAVWSLDEVEALIALLQDALTDAINNRQAW